MAYDPALGTTVMFGGASSGTNVNSETWTFCCSPFTWKQLTGLAHTPPARYEAAFAYDGTTGRMLLVGGYSPTLGYLGDAWEFDGTDWTQIASTTPRAYASIAYDTVRHKVYVYGGVGTSGVVRSDTVAWDGTSWTTAATTGPSARYSSAMAFDTQLGATVLFGGITGSNYPADTWTFNGTTWTQQSPASSPTGRAYSSNAYDDNANQVVIMGGVDATGTYLNDTWRYDGTLWTKAAGIASPSGRAYAQMAYVPDIGAESAVIFGGFAGTSGVSLGDQWFYTHMTPLIINQLGTSTTSFQPGQVVPFRVTVGNQSNNPHEVSSVVDTLPAGLSTTNVAILNSDGSPCTATSTPACAVSSTPTGSTLTISSFQLLGAGQVGDNKSFTLETVANSGSATTPLSCFVTGPGSLTTGQSYYADQVTADTPLDYYRLGSSDTGSTAINKGTLATAGNGTFTGTFGHGIGGALRGDADTAAAFNGTNSQVAVPALSAAGASGTTLEAWINPSTGVSYGGLVDLKSASGTSEIALSGWAPSHALALTVSTSSGHTTSLITQDGLQPGGWQLVAGTVSTSGVMTLYRNGVPISTTSGYAPDVTSYTQNYVGRSVSGNYLAGSLDEVAIYPTALPQGRLTAHYQAGVWTGGGTSSASLVSEIGSTYEQQVRGALPNGYWRLDEPSGATTAFDSSDHRAAGTNGTGITAGAAGAIANDIDGSYTYGTGSPSIQVPDSTYVGMTGDVTFEAWVKPPAAFTNNMSLLGKASTSQIANPYLFYLAGNTAVPKLALGNGSTSVTVTGQQAVPLDNKWHHLAVTRAGTAVTFYLDGSPEGPAQTASITTTNAAQPLYIGGLSSGNFSYQGGLDEVAIYPSALLAGQISSHYSIGKGYPTYGMLTSTVVPGSSPTGSNGALSQTAIIALPICGAVPLGLESWWRYHQTPLGSRNTASVNAADGNLVISADDSTQTAGHGHLAYGIHRSYNSLASDDIGLPGSIGAGWQLNMNQTDSVVGSDVGGDGLDVSNTLETLTHPLSIVLLDRDGTRHAFTPSALSTAVPIGSPNPILTPQVLSTIANRTLCVDVRYNAPAGVHVSLWRYIAIPSGQGCSNTTGAVVVGYVGERTDRLRYEFGPNGELLALTDAAGVSMTYLYDKPLSPLPSAGVPIPPLGNLRAIYEPGSGCTASGSGPSVTFTPHCRVITFSYSTDTAAPCPHASYDHSECIIDTAGRTTEYDLTITNQLVRVLNPDGSNVTYSYGTCGGGPNELCTVTDANGHSSNFTYGPPPTSLNYVIANDPTPGTNTTVPLLGENPVNSIVDRRGYTTFVSYSSDGATTDFDTDPNLSSPSLADCSSGAQLCRRTQYSGIDTRGRVAETDQGAATSTSGPWLTTALDTWDKTGGTTCRMPTSDTTIDNNLCEHKQLAYNDTETGQANGVSTPDEDTQFSYTPEGRPLLARQIMTAGNLDTTYGYHVQYAQAGATSTSTLCSDWTVTGSGAVNKASGTSTQLGCTTGTAPGSPILTISDRTQSLPPRGNAAASGFAAYLTDYQVDDTATLPPNTTNNGNVCSNVPGTSNTGLTCQSDMPTSSGVSQGTGSTCAGTITTSPYVCSRYVYDNRGQKTRYQTPASTAVGGASYAYTYYTDSDLDASNNVNAGGWLKAITDPTNGIVLFAYDRAGNTLRSYDRDAAAADGVTPANLTSSFSNTTVLPLTVERDYGPYPGSPNGATAASAPWRWSLSNSDQLGNRTNFCPDLNGNTVLIRKPKGSGGTAFALTGATCVAAIAAPANYDMTMAFDARDQAISMQQPAERAAGHPTATTYNAFGEISASTDATLAVKTVGYDLAGRPTVTSWTRSNYTAGSAANQCAPLTAGGAPTITTSANAPLPSGRILCRTSQTHDGVENVTSATDATAFPDAPSLKNTTITTYDAVHRAVSTLTPRSHTSGGAVVYERADNVYDADSHVVRHCSARDFDPSEGQLASLALTCATAPTPWYGGTTSYDPAGRAVSTTSYRAPTGTADNTSPAGAKALLSCLYYDADGNRIAVQDANAGLTSCQTTSSGTDPHTISVTYNLLDRKGGVTTYRTVGNSHTSSYYYSPGGDLIRVHNPPGNTADTSGTDTDYAYDAAHRATDTVIAADNTTITSVGPADGAHNIHTRQTYDADNNVIQRYAPNAFVTSGTTPTADSMLSTQYDTDDRPLNQITPRYSTAAGRTSLGATTGDSQVAECPTAPALTPPYAAYATGVAACVSSLAYDGDGRSVTSTSAAAGGGNTNRYTTTSYTDDGLVAATTGPDPSRTDGSRITMSTNYYDGANRVLSSADAQNHTSTIAYTDDGLHATVTAPPGAQDSPTGSATTHITSNVYDANGNLITMLNPANITTQTKYYSDGTTADHIQDPAGVNSDTHYAYDYLTNPTAVFSPVAVAAQGPAATSLIYTSGANKPSDPQQAATLNTYTADNMLLTRSKPIDAAGTNQRVSTYDYFDNGNKKTVTLSTSGTTGGSQTFDYFSDNRLKSQMGRASGSPIDTDGSAGIITTTYDADGDTTGISQASGTSLSSTFYLDDKLRTITDGNTTTGYAYDGAGQPTLRQLTIGAGTPQNTTITHTDAGQQLLVTNDQLTTKAWGYTYDTLGRTTVRNYGPVSNPNSGPNQSSTANYDTDNQLLHLTVTAGAATPAKWDYRYDNGYRVTSQAFAGTGASALTPDQDTYTYAYDTAGRASQFTTTPTSGTATTNNISWDKDNNRTGYGLGATAGNGTCTASGSTTCATYNADDTVNLVTTSSGTKQDAYDSAGRLCSDGTTTYSYDGYDRTTGTKAQSSMTCVSPSGSPTSSYAYDPMDRQRTHTEGATNTTVSYLGMSQTVAYEAPNVGSSVVYQFDGSGTQLAATTGSSTQLLNDDGRGNISTIADATTPAAVACTVRFDPFGSPQQPVVTDTAQHACNTGASKTDAFYQASRKDQTAGTYQFGSRTYNPGTAAFSTPDSYRTEASASDQSVGTDPLTADTYAYVNGDPVNSSDPSGHRPICDGCNASDAGQVLRAYTEAQAQAQSAPTRTGYYCAFNLNCSKNDFSNLSADERISFARNLGELYAERFGTRNWFNNIIGVVKFERKNNLLVQQWWNTVNINILQGIQDGLREATSGGTSENAGASAWKHFFESRRTTAGKQDSAASIVNWARAEDLSTQQGVSIARDNALPYSERDAAVLESSNVYRFIAKSRLAKYGDMAANSALDVACPITSTVGLGCYGFKQDVAQIDPRNAEATFAGANLVYDNYDTAASIYKPLGTVVRWFEP